MKREEVERIKYLKTLYNRVENLNCNQYHINELSKLIHTELRNEQRLENPSKNYIRNINQTIEKQLEPLLNSRKKPINRTYEMEDCKVNFKQDIDEELGRINTI